MVCESQIVCQRTRSGMMAEDQSYPTSRLGPRAPRSAVVFICTSKALTSEPPSCGSPHSTERKAVEQEVIHGGSGRAGSPGSVLHVATWPGSTSVPSLVHGDQPQLLRARTRNSWSVSESSGSPWQNVAVKPIVRGWITADTVVQSSRPVRRHCTSNASMGSPLGTGSVHSM